MRLPDRIRPQEGINVTPLVDVFLVLLVIFMITAPVLKSALEVALPEASVGSKHADTGLTLELMQNGRIICQGEAFDLKDLLPFLQSTRTRDSLSTRIIFLAADGRVPYKEVVDLLDHLHLGGFTQVGLMTDPPSRSKK